MDDEPGFYRVREDGKVHVLKRRIFNPSLVPEGTEPETHEQGMVAAIYAWWVARCGRRDPIYPPNGTIESFHDDEICTRCYFATPVAERDRLFDHPIPDEEADG